MRISDWSSDVCSSDLAGAQARRAPAWRLALRLPPPACEVGKPGALHRLRARSAPHRAAAIAARLRASRGARTQRRGVALRRRAVAALSTTTGTDRKSVVWGKSVTVRVDLGGCPVLKKTNPKQYYQKKNI